MRITAKGEYALMALLELSRTYDSNEVHSLDQIAERQQIPHQFLVQIFQSLRHAKLVESRRGSAGGYRLAKAPQEITVGQILELVEGELFVVHNGSGPDGTQVTTAASALRELWGSVEKAIRKVVDKTTLEDLRIRMSQNDSAMFYI